MGRARLQDAPNHRERGRSGHLLSTPGSRYGLDGQTDDEERRGNDAGGLVRGGACNAGSAVAKADHKRHRSYERAMACRAGAEHEAGRQEGKAPQVRQQDLSSGTAHARRRPASGIDRGRENSPSLARGRGPRPSKPRCRRTPPAVPAPGMRAHVRGPSTVHAAAHRPPRASARAGRQTGGCRPRAGGLGGKHDPTNAHLSGLLAVPWNASITNVPSWIRLPRPPSACAFGARRRLLAAALGGSGGILLGPRDCQDKLGRAAALDGAGQVCMQDDRGDGGLAGAPCLGLRRRL